MGGAVAACFVMVVTSGFALYGVFKSPVFGITAWSFLDVFFFGVIAFGIWKLSRVAAAVGLTYYLVGQGYLWATIGPKNPVLSVLFTLFFIHGIRGTFSYRRLKFLPETGRISPSVAPNNYGINPVAMPTPRENPPSDAAAPVKPTGEIQQQHTERMLGWREQDKAALAAGKLRTSAQSPGLARSTATPPSTPPPLADSTLPMKNKIFLSVAALAALTTAFVAGRHWPAQRFVFVPGGISAILYRCDTASGHVDVYRGGAFEPVAESVANEWVPPEARPTPPAGYILDPKPSASEFLDRK